MGDEYNYRDNFLTSAGGSVIGAVILLVGWIARNKCRHTKSKCYSPCCEFSAQEDSLRQTTRELRLELARLRGEPNGEEPSNV